jgi:hypothetical protein
MPQQQRQMPPQQYMQQQQQQQQQQNVNQLNGSWQSDKDTPHRREMIQHMYVVVRIRVFPPLRVGRPPNISTFYPQRQASKER